MRMDFVPVLSLADSGFVGVSLEPVLDDISLEVAVPTGLVKEHVVAVLGLPAVFDLLEFLCEPRRPDVALQPTPGLALPEGDRGVVAVLGLEVEPAPPEPLHIRLNPTHRVPVHFEPESHILI